jgi:tetratricopeptide (TPR) repeat protein
MKMKRLCPNHGRCALAAQTALVLLLAALPASAKEGFGFFTKTAASVMRTTPAPVPLLGTRISVQATSTEAANSGLAQRIQTQLEAALLARDSRLATDTAAPETLITVTVLQNAHSEKWERRKETETREAGKDAKGKTVYQNYEVEVNYKVVTHAFEASYKVTDRAKRSSLDAGPIHAPFENAFREGKDAPEAFNLENAAIEKAANQIANRLTPTREKIGVLLPKGSLEDLAPLAEAGQWNKYLEALEKRSPASNPIDESYHQYALGTAYEALGYAADEPATTLKYLEQADSFYNKALEANPKEKFFSQAYDSLFSSKKAMAPLGRVQSALVSYRRIKDFKDTDEVRLAAKDAGGKGEKSLAGGAAGGAGGAERLDNAAVIRMVQAGLAQDIVLTAIVGATENAFDISSKGLIELSEAKVDRQIILRIQEVAGGKRIPAKAPKKKPAASAKKPSGQGPAQ